MTSVLELYIDATDPKRPWQKKRRKVYINEDKANKIAEEERKKKIEKLIFK